MALGDGKGFGNNNGGDSNKLYEKTYYSRISIRDYTRNSGRSMNISYRSGMMIIAIDEPRQGSFEKEPIVDVFLTSTKAKLFLKAIEAYETEKSHSDKGAYGVATGMGDVQRAIMIHAGVDGSPAITIGKFDGTSGTWIKQETYEFNTEEYAQYITWKDKTDNGSTTLTNVPNIEFEFLKQALINFVNNADGATAYSVADMTRYDYRGILNKMNPIYNKLGIEINTFSGSSNNRGSFFNNSGSSRTFGTSTSKTLDDLPFADDDED